MDQSAPDAMLDRIEAALDRVEAAAGAARSRASAAEARHGRLREAAQATLAGLDAMIAGHEREGA